MYTILINLSNFNKKLIFNINGYPHFFNHFNTQDRNSP